VVHEPINPDIKSGALISPALDWFDAMVFVIGASSMLWRISVSAKTAPEAKEVGAVPPSAGDSEGNLGQAVIGLAIPGKAVGHHHHPLRLSVPLPDQDRTGSKLGPLLVKAGQAGGHCRSSLSGVRAFQYLPGCVIEIAIAIDLDSIGNDCKQQVPR
jgi:hypothetical protein